MSQGELIDALKTKHQALDAEIEKENSRPNPDDMLIASLKKQKLKIKDEIASLSRE
ncbi:MAG: YdcH family protein [Rhodospirillales bacterium]|nr:YdcH family protein [Rhodospirillales bacterium]